MSDLIDNYKKAYDNRLGFGESPALILVDFVEAYFDPTCELFADVEDSLEAALGLVDVARVEDIPVIYTNVVYRSDGSDGGVFFQKVKPLRHFVEGSAMGAWASGIAPRHDELVVSKQYPSAFFGTDLASELTRRDVDTVLITGLTTSGCVRATCLDACCHGFRPMVVKEACGDRHAGPHEANLFDMDAKYGDVVSLQVAVDYLNTLPKR